MECTGQMPVCAAAAAQENSACSIQFRRLTESLQNSYLLKCPDPPPSSCSFFQAFRFFGSLKQDVGTGIVILSSHTLKTEHLKGFSNVKSERRKAAKSIDCCKP